MTEELKKVLSEALLLSKFEIQKQLYLANFKIEQAESIVRLLAEENPNMLELTEKTLSFYDTFMDTRLNCLLPHEFVFLLKKLIHEPEFIALAEEAKKVAK